LTDAFLVAHRRKISAQFQNLVTFIDVVRFKIETHQAVESFLVRIGTVVLCNHQNFHVLYDDVLFPEWKWRASIPALPVSVKASALSAEVTTVHHRHLRWRFVKDGEYCGGFSLKVMSATNLDPTSFDITGTCLNAACRHS